VGDRLLHRGLGFGGARAVHVGIIEAMEADRLNLIQNSLSDLAARSAELRRYL
jgi:hypothetical protein